MNHPRPTRIDKRRDQQAGAEERRDRLAIHQESQASHGLDYGNGFPCPSEHGWSPNQPCETRRFRGYHPLLAELRDPGECENDANE